MLVHADDLSVLALLLTAAKVLFCAGALDASLLLLQLTEPVEQAVAAAQPLHLSSIRNEAAYAALIRKLLQQLPSLPLHRVKSVLGEDTGPAAGAPEVLCVCGDSHVLPRESGIKCVGLRTYLNPQPYSCSNSLSCVCCY
jgi:hypothetical protein